MTREAGLHRERVIIGISLILLGAVILAISITSLYRPTQVQTSYTSTQKYAPITSKRSSDDLIKEYLSTVDPDIRSTAMNILYYYLNKSYSVVEKTVDVSAGDWKWLSFEYFYSFTYELTISTSGNCIGRCDIEVEVLDSDLRTIRYLGRVYYLRENLTFLQLFGTFSSSNPATYYLKLDNTYSVFTSKRVYVNIRAYVAIDEVFNDKAYKIMALALWASYNLRYVSDPYGFDYVASPRETLRARAGDCDDFAVLLASMYRHVGLRSAVGSIDTDGDGRIDHAVALVALENYEIEYFKNSIRRYSIVFGKKYAPRFSYFKGDGVIWLIIDPLFASRDEPWYVDHEPYYLKKLIE